MEQPYQFDTSSKSEKKIFVPQPLKRFAPVHVKPKELTRDGDIKIIKEQLNNIIGKRVIFGKKEFVLNEYSFVRSTGILVMFFNKDNSRRDKNIDEAFYFLKNISSYHKKLQQKAANAPSHSGRPVTSAIESENKVYNELKSTSMADIDLTKSENITENMRNIVLDSISKIQTDAGYIPQANAIIQQIQLLINLKKVEIELKKQV